MRSAFSWLAVLGLLASCGPDDGELVIRVDPVADVEGTGEGESSLLSQPKPVPFKVLTYNVRHATPEDVGRWSWTQRRPHVIALIKSRDPDVFGVQEASSKAVSDPLVAAFADTHHVYRPPNGSPKMIFFRKGRFELAPGKSSGWRSAPNPYAEGTPCRSNAGGRSIGWVRVVDTAANRGSFVLNLHPAHGNCPAGREAYARLVHQIISEESGGWPIVAFGDLNSDPQKESPVAGDDSIALLEGGGTGYSLYRTARFTGDTTKGVATFNSCGRRRAPPPRGWISSFRAVTT